MLAQFLAITALSPNYSGTKNLAYIASIKKPIPMPLPHNKNRTGYYLLLINDKQAAAEIERNSLFLSKMTGDYAGAQYLHHVKVQSAIGLSVIILFFGHVIKRKRRYKALIAHRLGGHAPPICICFACLA